MRGTDNKINMSKTSYRIRRVSSPEDQVSKYDWGCSQTQNHMLSEDLLVKVV